MLALWEKFKIGAGDRAAADDGAEVERIAREYDEQIAPQSSERNWS